MSILLTDKHSSKSKKKVRFNLDNNSTNTNTPTPDDTHHKKLTALQIAHRRNVLGTKDMFLFNYGKPLEINSDIIESTMKLKINNQYSDVKNHPLTINNPTTITNTNNTTNTNEPPKKKQKTSHQNTNKQKPKNKQLTDEITSKNITTDTTSTMIESIIDNLPQNSHEHNSTNTTIVTYNQSSNQISKPFKKKKPKPQWHRPWKPYRVISGHLGWVQSVCMDPSNEYFITGSADRTIKIWDLASGSLKLTLTGHISSVRGVAISSASPYMFSCGEDKKVCCWDLTQNKIIRHYHGHLSGVYCLSLHPTLNILFTGGRDSTCRVWDIRTKAQIMVLSGHKHTVLTCKSQSYKPQIISGSMDKTIRTYDLRNAGKTITVLTHHKKSIRSIAIHPKEYTYISGGADNIKVWKCPNSDFLRNMNEKPNNIIETLSVNEDNLLISGHQTGHLKFWDYKNGFKLQEICLDPQPGSLHSEAGILASTFDITGTRLITTEADKTIKMWKADTNAVPPQ